jgi:hypothetical protein
LREQGIEPVEVMEASERTVMLTKDAPDWLIAAVERADMKQNTAGES